MRSKRIVVFLFAVSFFISLQSGFTEGEEISKNNEFKLGQVVVTATRTERAIGEVPASVSVVTEENK